MNKEVARSDMVMSGIDSLEKALARLRTVPEYTMQAVTQQTGVPPDTLRSWERRHGFPAPSRNDSNRRLYSERDIAAVNWLRDQSEHGQGISEAVHMLRSRLDAAGEPTPVASPEPVSDPRANRPMLVPVDTLRNALAHGRLADAQSAWDHIAIAVSAEALGSDIILPIVHDIRASDIPLHALRQAIAFLERKATTLLDHSVPDRGSKTVCLVSAGDVESQLPAITLATTLSRAGHRMILPVLDISTVETIDMIRQTSPDIVIMVADASASRSAIRAFARLLPDQRVYGWTNTGDVPFPHSIEELPSSLAEIAAVLG